MPGIIRMKTSSVSPFHFSIAISKRLDPGSMPGMTRCSLVVLVLGCVHHQHVTTTPRDHVTFPPSDILLILSILSSAFYSHSTFPRPNRSTYIYGGRVCNIWLAGGLPAVILNPVRDDLRMMAPNAVAARDGGMKQKRNISLDLRGGSDKLPCSMIWRTA